MSNDHFNATEVIFCFNHIIGKNINSIRLNHFAFLPSQEIHLLDTERRTPSKMKSGKVLSIYDFFQYNFLCPIVDTVHGSNPGHLVTGFQILCHALRYLHLLNNQG